MEVKAGIGARPMAKLAHLAESIAFALLLSTIAALLGIVLLTTRPLHGTTDFMRSGEKGSGAVNFKIGDCVRDCVSGATGSVVYIYSEPEIKNEIIAVLFDRDEAPLAVSVDCIEEIQGRPRK